MPLFYRCLLYKFPLLGSLVLLTFAAYGQRGSSLPLGALPMQYNGSFAGEGDSPRISSNFGIGYGEGYRQGGYYRGGYHQQVSYDQFIPALRSGIGAAVLSSHAANPWYKYNGQGFSVAVAPKISLNGKYTLSPSVSLQYTAGHSKNRGIVAMDTLTVPDGYRSKRWLGRAGLLFNTDKFYVGYSVDVVNHMAFEYVNGPEGSIRGNRFSSYLQLGYTFRKSPESHFSVTPQVAFYIGDGVSARRKPYERFGIYWFEGYNVTFRYKQFIWGVNNMGLHAGWQNRRVKLMATNAINFEGGINAHHAANLSLRYLFKE